MYKVVLLTPCSVLGFVTFPSTNTWLILRRKRAGSAGCENLWSFKEDEKRSPEHPWSRAVFLWQSARSLLPEAAQCLAAALSYFQSTGLEAGASGDRESFLS